MVRDNYGGTDSECASSPYLHACTGGISHTSMRGNSHDNAQHYSVNMQEQIVTSFSHANMYDYHSRSTVV